MLAGKTGSLDRMAPGPEPKNLRKISEEEPEQSTENED
jgi:hypothetical protein